MMSPLMKKIAAGFLMATMISQNASAFCGFYVAKADGTLKNKTSQVILVRDGDKNVVTMYNDFKGSFKDFAMVVPVPVVLKEKDIKVVDQSIFTRFDDYSRPRLVEYFDENPCYRREYDREDKMSAMESAPMREMKKSKAPAGSSVTIEAQYLVGEYDILILSAKESSGLKTWLTENGYKIPEAANEVLEPYIKSNLKFFVVKVNEAEQKKLGGNFLRPIQISFSSPKFMLPIRLGMANADGDQDMIVYALSKKGRIECTNYRTLELPTSKNIPLFVKDNFGAFYGNLFQHQWNKEGRSVSMLEYAWDVSPQNYVKCDPCVGNPPNQQDLVQAGVWWLKKDWSNYDDVYNDEEVVSNKVYFTRLHIRYNRKDFPQDLVFQVTPNTENYQARYIITHPAEGDLSCAAGKAYLKELKQRRKGELDQLVYLTGKNYENWDLAYEETNSQDLKTASYAAISTRSDNDDSNDQNNGFAGLLTIFSIGLAGFGAIYLLKKPKMA